MLRYGLIEIDPLCIAQRRLGCADIDLFLCAKVARPNRNYCDRRQSSDQRKQPGNRYTVRSHEGIGFIIYPG